MWLHGQTDQGSNSANSVAVQLSLSPYLLCSTLIFHRLPPRPYLNVVRIVIPILTQPTHSPSTPPPIYAKATWHILETSFESLCKHISTRKPFPSFSGCSHSWEIKSSGLHTCLTISFYLFCSSF